MGSPPDGMAYMYGWMDVRLLSGLTGRCRFASIRFGSVGMTTQKAGETFRFVLFTVARHLLCLRPKNARAYFFMSVFAAHACLHCTRISITSCETRYADVNPLSKWARKVPLHLSNIYSFLQGTREFNKKPLNISLIQHCN